MGILLQKGEAANLQRRKGHEYQLWAKLVVELIKLVQRIPTCLLQMANLWPQMLEPERAQKSELQLRLVDLKVVVDIIELDELV